MDSTIIMRNGMIQITIKKYVEAQTFTTKTMHHIQQFGDSILHQKRHVRQSSDPFMSSYPFIVMLEANSSIICSKQVEPQVARSDISILIMCKGVWRRTHCLRTWKLGIQLCPKIQFFGCSVMQNFTLTP